MSRRPVHIGLSCRIFHPESGGVGLKGKTLQVLEQSVAQWAASRDTLVLMVPSVLQDGALQRSNIRIRDYAEYLDGLILQGGADVMTRVFGTNIALAAIAMIWIVGILSMVLPNVPVVIGLLLIVKGYLVHIEAVPEEALGAGFAVLSGRWDRGQGFWTTPASQRVPASARAAFFGMPMMSFGGSGILVNCVAIAILLRIDWENRQMMRGRRS